MTQKEALKIGIDFDNTIVCYDDVFFEEALKRNWITSLTPRHKQSIKQVILQERGNDAWTDLQGFVYSKGISRARMALGFGQFMRWTLRWQIDVFIVSHKTRFAAKGDAIDLHEPARQWLVDNGFFSSAGFCMNEEKSVFFEETLAAKLERIATLGCTHFVDDHVDVLRHAKFPPQTQGLLYDPTNARLSSQVDKSFADWNAIDDYFKRLS